MFLTKQNQTDNALCRDVLISGLFSGYEHDFFFCVNFFLGGGGGCGCSKIVQYIKNRLNNMYLLCTVYSFLTLSEAKLAHTSGQDQPGKKADGK